MKIILIMFVCSQLHGNCLPPIRHVETFTDIYDCMVHGYEEASKMTQALGKDLVNKDKLYVRFVCKEAPNPIEKETKINI